MLLVALLMEEVLDASTIDDWNSSTLAHTPRTRGVDLKNLDVFETSHASRLSAAL